MHAKSLAATGAPESGVTVSAQFSELGLDSCGGETINGAAEKA
jgi:hypothetical protein